MDSFLHTDSEDSDQTGWVFTGRTCHSVGFVTRRLICKCLCQVSQTYIQTLCHVHSPFQIIYRYQQLSSCRVAAVKCFPVHRYSVATFTFSGTLGLLSSDIWKHNIAYVAAGGGVRVVAFSSISHEQIQPDFFFFFFFIFVGTHYFRGTPFSDYLTLMTY